jgi:hypothetical protein
MKMMLNMARVLGHTNMPLNMELIPIKSFGIFAQGIGVCKQI